MEGWRMSQSWSSFLPKQFLRIFCTRDLHDCQVRYRTIKDSCSRSPLCEGVHTNQCLPQSRNSTSLIWGKKTHPATCRIRFTHLLCGFPAETFLKPVLPVGNMPMLPVEFFWKNGHSLLVNPHRRIVGKTECTLFKILVANRSFPLLRYACFCGATATVCLGSTNNLTLTWDFSQDKSPNFDVWSHYRLKLGLLCRATYPNFYFYGVEWGAYANIWKKRICMGIFYFWLCWFFTSWVFNFVNSNQFDGTRLLHESSAT